MLDQWGDSTIDHLAVDPHRRVPAVARPRIAFDCDASDRGPQRSGDSTTTTATRSPGRASPSRCLTRASSRSRASPVQARSLQGPDLSLEANSDSDRNQDTYGHGTFMAGIIAAQDPVTLDKTGKPTGMSPNTQLGVTPGAHILAVKAATANSSADVSEIIAGLDWIIAHRNSNGMNVRVHQLVVRYRLAPAVPGRPARRSGRKRLAPRHCRGRIGEQPRATAQAP